MHRGEPEGDHHLSFPFGVALGFAAGLRDGFLSSTGSDSSSRMSSRIFSYLVRSIDKKLSPFTRLFRSFSSITTMAIPRFEYTLNCSRSASLSFEVPVIPVFENKMPNRDFTESRK